MSVMGLKNLILGEWVAGWGELYPGFLLKFF